MCSTGYKYYCEWQNMYFPLVAKVRVTRSRVYDNSITVNMADVKKCCTCTKSKCLQLYCVCFASKQMCEGCSCQNCRNNEDYEEERTRSIAAYNDRNVFTFRENIKEEFIDISVEVKRCNCKNSNCKKRYCECYKAGEVCTISCGCTNCKNVHKKELPLEFVREITPTKEEIEPMEIKPSDLPAKPLVHNEPPIVKQELVSISNNPINAEVIKYITACLISRAASLEAMQASETVIEHNLLEEMGRCLKQIIGNTNQNLE